MSDPRLAVIGRRFEGVRRILAFASGKGGVGKSCCSSTAALLLADRGMKAGLLDLDFHGASDHLILGIDPILPQEERGVLPLEGPRGLRYMGIAPFTAEHGVALRGDAVTEAIRELLAVIVWGELDALIIDLPPGIGEAVLDLCRHLARAEIVLVTTPHALSLQVMGRLVEVLDAGGVLPAGYLLNMVSPHENAAPRGAGPHSSANSTEGARSGGASVSAELEGRLPGGPFLGEIPFARELEGEIGSPERLLGGRFAAAMSEVLGNLL